MRIVILGAGQVGGTLAETLASEDNDITLIDLDEERLQELQHRLDIQTVCGSAAHPSILVKAGIEQADMLIAVTDSDEINMMGCQVAYSLFRTPSKIARIRSRHYDGFDQVFCNDHIPVDERINPEKLVTDHIQNLMRYPGTNQVIDFAQGKVLLVGIQPRENGSMLGKTLAELHDYLDDIDARAVAIFRDNAVVEAIDTHTIALGDDVLFIASPEAIQKVLITLGRYAHPNRRLMIAGGGHIGSKLALSLESAYRVKVIDHNTKTSSRLASHMHKGTVLQGDIADKNLLINENIEFTDVFCAVTNDDEANIMACVLAKRLGARYTMALVNRKAYVELIEDSSIDYAISPQLITIGSILARMRRGNMVKVHRLRYDNSEAIEIAVTGDKDTSQVIGRKLQDIDIPSGCKIVAIVRDQEVVFLEPDTLIESGDHIIVLLLKFRSLRRLEALFQVSLNFLG